MGRGRCDGPVRHNQPLPMAATDRKTTDALNCFLCRLNLREVFDDWFATCYHSAYGCKGQFSADEIMIVTKMIDRKLDLRYLHPYSSVINH